MKTLFIGIGNPLRGDDGLGWQAAQALVELPQGAGVEVLICHGLTPELAERLSRVDHVIFVDADARAGPGVLSCCPLSASAAPEAFSHYLTPEGLLAFTRMLYDRQPEAHLISLGAADFGYREGLSPDVQTALPLLLACLRGLLDRAHEVSHA